MVTVGSMPSISMAEITSIVKLMSPLALLKTIRDVVRMFVLTIILILWPLSLSLLWGYLYDRNKEGVYALKLASSTTLTGILSFFLTFVVGAILSGMLTKNFEAIERFNAFAGQCYDMCLLLSGLRIGVNEADTVMLQDTMVLTGMLPYLVKFIMRESFDIRAFLKHSDWNKRDRLIKEYEREYKEAKDNCSINDDGLPFLVMYEMLVFKLELLKDSVQLSPVEWREVTSRLQTIYGPWGDMCTRNSYGLPRYIAAFYWLLIIAYYFVAIPTFLEEFGFTNGMVVTGLMVFTFSGCYYGAQQVANPYLSKLDHPFFYSKDETVTNVAKCTNAAIQRLFVKHPNKKTLHGVNASMPSIYAARSPFFKNRMV